MIDPTKSIIDFQPQKPIYDRKVEKQEVKPAKFNDGVDPKKLHNELKDVKGTIELYRNPEE